MQVVPVLTQDPRRRELVLMLVLTFSTGIVDAVGYLRLDLTFAGNMTGNVLILGMGLGRAQHLPVAGPAIALLAFAVGAAFGGRLLRGSQAGWDRRTTVAVGLTGATTALAALLLLGLRVQDPGVEKTAIALLAGAMGLQAAAARQLGVADVTTVVVTSTLTRLAADLGAGSRRLWARRAGAVALICAGGVVGALLERVHLAVALGLAAALVLAVAALGHAGAAPAHPRASSS